MTLWFCHHNPHGYRDEVRRLNLDENPCPAVMAGGINGDNLSHYWIEDDGKQMTTTTDKPVYRVPSLAGADCFGLKRCGPTCVLGMS